MNSAPEAGVDVWYWRERGQEVDFVLTSGKSSAAIEVKSGRRRELLTGIEAFAKRFQPKRKLLIGAQGIPLDEALSRPPEYWLA